jgi:hypothetical protein
MAQRQSKHRFQCQSRSIGGNATTINANIQKTWHYNITPVPRRPKSYQWLTPRAHRPTVEDQPNGNMHNRYGGRYYFW